MKPNPRFSYVITTYNKLPYLEEVMRRLLQFVEADEEIVVVDGGSSDGTQEFLKELFKKGKIHQYLSEKDKGEAHGFNKGFLMARGEIIKLITDDDAYYFPGVKECKNFMLAHPEVDVVAGNIGVMDIDRLDTVTFAKNFQNHFEEWRKKNTPVFFCGLSLMFRKKSLALTGLFNPMFIQIDVEFSTRITKQGTVNLAWYTNALVVAIRNAQSGTNNISLQRNIREQKLISAMYGWKRPSGNDLLYSARESVKSLIRPIRNSLIKGKKYEGNKPFAIKSDFINGLSEKSTPQEKAFLVADHWLNEFNSKHKGTFLQNHSKK